MNSKLVVLSLLVVVVLINLVGASRTWHQFKAQYGKKYGSRAEESMRRSIYLDNKKLVDNFNRQNSNAYQMRLNHLSDWTSEEISKMNGLRVSKSNYQLSESQSSYLQSVLGRSVEVPDAVDWRKVTGRVTHVKNQGNCGSCWAFASTGVLEGQEVVQKFQGATKNETIELSEQNLVDCSKDNMGCSGGSMDLALDFIKKEGGIESEGDYPYKAEDYDKCRFNKSKSVFSDEGSVVINDGDEEKLKALVAKFGPVSVGIFAPDSLSFYHSGVFYDQECVDKPDLNHGVLIVGYGTDTKHGDYWIVKNSWSSEWGEEGYFKLARNKENHCSIGLYTVIPTF